MPSQPKKSVMPLPWRGGSFVLHFFSRCFLKIVPFMRINFSANVQPNIFTIGQDFLLHSTFAHIGSIFALLIATVWGEGGRDRLWTPLRR